MHGKSLRVFASLAVASLLGGTAMAQDPTFSLENVTGRAGETVNVGVFVTGGVSNTSALNFTVQVDPTDASKVVSITGNSTLADGSNYAYADNTLTANNTMEYRGVLYAQSSSVPPFSTTASTRVATISVQLAEGLTNGDVINLNFRQFSEDMTTGLVGLSDSAGNSIVEGASSPSTTRPKVQNGTITIGGFGFNQDFRGINELPSGWEFAEVIPGTGAGLAGTQSSANGFGITFNAEGAFGFLQRLSDANSSPETGRVLLTSWTIGQSSSNPFDLPAVRLRTTAADSSWTQEAVVQETQPSAPAPVTVPTAGNDKVINTLSFVPAVVNIGTPTGFVLAADIVAFATNIVNGTEGTTFFVRRLEVSDFDPASLTGGTEVVNFNFSNNANGFEGFGSVGGLDAPVAVTADGLTVTANDAPGAGGFAFGFFERTLSQWVADSTKVYRVQYLLKSSAPTRDRSVVGRMRMTAGATSDFVVESIITSGGDSSASPTNEGETYTAYFVFPADVNGQQIKASFDVYNTAPDDTGSLSLGTLVVTAFDAPFSQ